MRDPLDCSCVPMRLTTIALLSALACSGCRDDPFTAGNACEPTVSITVSPSSAPEFTWQPACGVSSLHVVREAAGTMWQVSSNPQPDFTPTNEIQSGVVYGQVPEGAREFIPAEPLQVGQAYHVVLSITDSQGNRTQVGAASFTGVAE
jgi:hypothetical protein